MRLLISEKSLETASVLRRQLARVADQVELVEGAADTLDRLREDAWDCLIADFDHLELSGDDFLKQLEAAAPAIVYLSAQGSISTSVRAMRAGADDFLVKPVSPEKLIATVEKAAEHHRREVPSTQAVAPAETRRELMMFYGESAPMLQVFNLIETAGACNAPVFITGESGTGKELCAEAIHQASPNADGPFIALNCAAIPQDLIESEIFGHVKGAFTGAVSDRDGAAAAAHGGSLFLDELCEMDIRLQAKLLRFIQTGYYRRLGEMKDRSTNIRFICATNRDPLEEIKAGRFREDLYYRLHVIPIHMPALRERGEDIVNLARRFLNDFSRREGKPFTALDDAVETMIRAYDWPGNVRQLRNVIQSVVLLNHAETATAEMFPDLPIGAEAIGGVGATPLAQRPPEDDQSSLSVATLLSMPLAEIEKIAIEAAIEDRKSVV